jgi:hypothetical protein
MPGHVKLGKAGEPDPDPAPYLIVSMEMKREDMLKPYDPKKSVWVPTDDHGFREGLLDSDDGTKAVVMCGHEVGGCLQLIAIYLWLPHISLFFTIGSCKANFRAPLPLVTYKPLYAYLYIIFQFCL